MAFEKSAVNLLTAKTRITIGLVCLSVSLLLVASFVGMIPDRHGAVLDGRRKLCEAIAVNSSVLVSRKDLKRLDAVLQSVVRRNEDILSAGVRRVDGQLVVEIGDHAAQWNDLDGEKSIESQFQEPLRAGPEKWGTVEIRFLPLREPGLMGILRSPITRLVAFFGGAGFVLYLLYLRKMLKHLDPSQAIPGRVRSALDTMAEGLVVLDTKEQIVLANRAFGSLFGR